MSEDGPSRKRLKPEKPADMCVDPFLSGEYDRIKFHHEGLVLFFVDERRVQVLRDDAIMVMNELKLPIQDTFVDANGSTVTAKFDIASLPIHLSILVARGHIVGLVRKAKNWSDVTSPVNSRATRELTELHTRSTLIGIGLPVDGDSSFQLWNSFLLCICEVQRSTGTGASDIALLALCPRSGEVTFDRIKGVVGNTHSQQARLRFLVSKIKPVEILLVRVSRDTLRMVTEILATLQTDNEKIRVTRLKKKQFDSLDLNAILLEECGQNDCDFEQVFPRKPAEIRICLQAVLAYLLPFQMVAVVRLIAERGLTEIPSTSLDMDYVTICHLELFQSFGTAQCEGSLFWYVARHVSSVFGVRLLKHWIAHPSADPKVILGRSKAVDYLVMLSCHSGLPRQLASFLQRLPDLEAEIATIFYKRCTVSGYLKSIRTLVRVKRYFSTFFNSFTMEQPLPQTIRESFETVIDKLSNLEINLLDNLNHQGNVLSRKPSNVFLNTSAYPSITAVLDQIANVQSRLEILGAEEIEQVFGSGACGYTTYKGHQYVMAVSLAKLHLVPSNWIYIWKKRPKTMYVRSPVMTELVNKLIFLRRQLNYEYFMAWRSYLNRIRSRYVDIRMALESVATLDCLMALAAVAQFEDLNCRPSVKCLQNGAAFLNICNCHHAVKEKVFSAGHLSLDEFYISTLTSTLRLDSMNCLVVTGSHKPSKRFFIELIGFIVVMAQIGAFVRARVLEIAPLTSLTVRLSVSLTDGGDYKWIRKSEDDDLRTIGLFSDATNKDSTLVLLDDVFFKALAKNCQQPLSEFEQRRICCKTVVVEILAPVSDKKLRLKKLKTFDYMKQYLGWR